MNGIVPVLQNIVKTERPLKEFALPILTDMAHNGKTCRKTLWQNDGLEFYITLLSDPYWQVTALDAIFVWLQEETARVEEKLLKDTNTRAIIRCFTTSKTNAFDNILEPLQKLLRLSPPIALSVGKAEFLLRIKHKLETHNKAVVRINLLKILRTICDASEQKETLIRQHGMYNTISRLAERDTAVLVRNMANDLIKACNERLKGSTSYRPSSRRRSMASTSTGTSTSASSSLNGSHYSTASTAPTSTSSRRHVSNLWAAPTLSSAAKEAQARPSSSHAPSAILRRSSFVTSRSFGDTGIGPRDIGRMRAPPPEDPLTSPPSALSSSPLRLPVSRQRTGNAYIPKRHRQSMNPPSADWDS